MQTIDPTFILAPADDIDLYNFPVAEEFAPAPAWTPAPTSLTPAKARQAGRDMAEDVIADASPVAALRWELSMLPDDTRLQAELWAGVWEIAREQAPEVAKDLMEIRPKALVAVR